MYKARPRQESIRCRGLFFYEAIRGERELTQWVNRSGFGSKILAQQWACYQTRIADRVSVLEHHPARLVV